ncbi:MULTISPECIES: tetrahydromethanopterin S-methyltransferase subunit E [Methanococcoides]|jgi:tetrahydromethanopterin S-methyltransferase subunit E|uniref:Tetrahydromethanopterin S-methyltransferase subunit E n=2 Tax=Methanococcoides TaxID=2225 RepID=A0A9E5DBJ6_9EURY|nr:MULTISPECIES: tetrahydromethanopterin S-methyltransferase subunit E [Methanococcoides]MCD4799982.1 tetrahydromethanopterin S-methyltransferase subunit E [Methanococcoides sp.]MCD4821716.1 tetrahydromethanopterin S-methyltransferase subunit E [Methanococcoides sp.]MCM1986458.1 tetrahydromethanopterin S-methyltransferase subunit E [Methanococcoides seepicolus]MDA0524910.1 tetrahydromethanopterin S-methyltransferase subunit E [Methanococcoides alaskense]MDR6222175.1 tetrahydromethanopterin S-m
MEPLMGMGVLALMGAAATIAGTTEDLESDVGSQSNPNSQVQLAPQMMYPHRIYNKAISGEPPSNALICAIGGTVASVLMTASLSVIFAIAIGALVATAVHGTYCITAYMGRTASQKRFRQPIYLDILRSHTPVMMGYAFITTFCILVVSYIMVAVLAHPFPLTLLAFIWGITVGAIGSSTGDVHYGAEREFQNVEFGSGLNAANSGNIVRKAESGLRNGIDNSWFCAKFGGPVTGLAFGMTVFLSGWVTAVFNPATSLTMGWLSVAAGVILVLLMIIWNRKIEVAARKAFGPYKEEEEVAA